MECLEKIQRIASKLVSHLRRFTYEEQLQKLRLTSLYDRRRGDSIEAYKLITGKVNVSKDQFLQPAHQWIERQRTYT